jgi:hypothetical protein
MPQTGSGDGNRTMLDEPAGPPAVSGATTSGGQQPQPGYGCSRYITMHAQRRYGRLHPEAPMYEYTGRPLACWTIAGGQAVNYAKLRQL